MTPRFLRRGWYVMAAQRLGTNAVVGVALSVLAGLTLGPTFLLVADLLGGERGPLATLVLTLTAVSAGVALLAALAALVVPKPAGRVLVGAGAVHALCQVTAVGISLYRSFDQLNTTMFTLGIAGFLCVPGVGLVLLGRSVQRKAAALGPGPA
ncbi:MAG TPA: hypothetical protein VNZ52_04415 [Candidatus Thermoplasmatota archaeon]|nr:hypothetical protein [Candidatus Thermoplasmatota archaeon]